MEAQLSHAIQDILKFNLNYKVQLSLKQIVVRFYKIYFFWKKNKIIFNNLFKNFKPSCATFTGCPADYNFLSTNTPITPCISTCC